MMELRQQKWHSEDEQNDGGSRRIGLARVLRVFELLVR